ncbi:ROK family protein [Virgibacillus salexigens]|uniref:ROK family protein n=1 Tax=Virgibacillus salexigens TaxID=61016 RepID=UPI00190B01B2|nr:ROK family protein [Virgibacillus salexigens]
MEYLSIDIGGTYIKYALLNENLELNDHRKEQTKTTSKQVLYQQIEQIIKEIQNEYNLSGIGISTAGIVDRYIGKVVYAGPTLPFYKGMEWKQPLTKKFSIPVVVENDVNAALLGEIWKGSMINKNNIFCITIGTGIGGAYYKNHLIDGANQQANSVGYLSYDPTTGTNYESRASTNALISTIKEHLDDTVTPESLFERAKLGCHKCLTIIRNWAKEIASGLAQIILLYDPEYIVIGGGISKQDDYLLNFIQKEIHHYLPKHFLKTKVRMAALHNHAALYGAIYPFLKTNAEASLH